MTCRLEDRHRAELDASAIVPEIIEARGYRSVMNLRAVPSEMFAHYQRRPGMLMPIRDVTGEIVTYQLKPDDPRTDGTTSKPVKYETAAHGRTCIDVPVPVRPHLRSADIPLWITEGCKKVDSALSHGIPCIVGLQGVDSWSRDSMALPDWKEIALRGRSVVIAFDSDVMTSDRVRGALERLASWLTMQQAHVSYLVMPDLPDGSKCGLDDWFASGRTYLELQGLIADNLPGTVMDWEDPIPLDPTTGPPFPLEALPGTIGQYVAAVAHSYQVPADLPALVGLGTLSATVGGKYAVSPLPDWTEPVHVMVMPTLRSGAKKSPVMREITAPVRAWEADRREADRETYAAWKAKRTQKEHKLSTLQKRAIKLEIDRVDPPQRDDGKSTQSRLRSLNAISEEIDKLVKELAADNPPRITQVIADNVTPEAAQKALHDQGGALAIISPEPAFLTNIAGRYSNDNPDLDVYLKGHAADPIRSNRITRDEDDVPRACLTLCISPQPDVVEAMGAVPGWIERGGAARLLPAFPDTSNIGFRRLHPDPIPRELRQDWGELVRRCLRLSHRPGQRIDGKTLPQEPHVLLLNPDAEPEWEAFRAWREAEMRPGGLFGTTGMDSWGEKLDGAVLRIAGLLHIATHEVPQDVEISAATIHAAITIGHYFHAHAAIMHAMSGKSRHGQARSVLEALRRVQGPHITARDFYQRVKNRAAFPSVDSLRPVLTTLEEHGWIRLEHRKPPIGRPSMIIHLHPDIGPQKSQNPDDATAEVTSETFETVFPGHDGRSATTGEPADLEPTGTEGWVEV